MRIKFNHYERVAGVFVLAAVAGSLTVTAGVALKKGWFAAKVDFVTVVKNAEGLHEGTVVQIAGLRAGSVESVELISAEEVRVHFRILEKFHQRVREDSQVQVVRPFVIGEKVLDISVGSETEAIKAAKSLVPAVDSFDVMDLVSGRKLGPFLGSIEAMTENLKILAEAFTSKERIQAFVAMFDRLAPLIDNLNKMSVGVTKVTDAATKKQRIEILLTNLTTLAGEMGRILPIMADEAPNMARQLPRIVENLAVLTEEFKKLTPVITTIAPELPRASQRAIEALDETVVLLKAMQKSFLLSGKVEDVRAEEAARDKAKAAQKIKDGESSTTDRQPAAEKK